MKATGRPNSLSLFAPSLWFACAAFSQHSLAQDSLPPVRQLISDTLALCNAVAEKDSEVLSQVAIAQCYLGEFFAARKTLQLGDSSDFKIQLAHQNCAQIEIERTGSIASIPSDLWQDERGTMQCKAALAFLERNEVEKALDQLRRIPKSPDSALTLFGVELIEILTKRQRKEACRTVLLLWALRLEQAESADAYRTNLQVPQLVKWLGEYDERPTAHAVCQHWRSILESDSKAAGVRGTPWAEYAKGLAALGDNEGASAAFSKAYDWLAEQRKNYPVPRKSAYKSWAESYAKVAARQAAVFGPEHALAGYNSAYEFASLSVDPSDRQLGDFAFDQIVAAQLEAGDENGTQETIKRFPSPRSKARCWLRISSHALAKGKTDAARAAIRAAFEQLDRDGFEPFVAAEMALVASNAGRSGEKEIAHKLFRRALALSAANKAPRADHPFIARFQIHGGMPIDAYQTIQSIPPMLDRAQPLADLCHALAKAEYETSKQPK